MRHYFQYILFCQLALNSCTGDYLRNNNLKDGVWLSQENQVLIIKDSLILFYPYYPYADWMIKNDTLAVGSQEDANSEIPEYAKHPIEKISDNKVQIEFLEGGTTTQTFHRVDQGNFRSNLDHFSMRIGECLLPQCDELIISVDANQGKWFLKELRDDVNSICQLSSEDLLILNFLIDKVRQSTPSGSKVFSNQMHAKYFTIDIKMEKGDSLTFVGDTGIENSEINWLVTYVWASALLNCTPDNFQRSLEEF